MSAIQKHQCPSCGGSLIVDGEKQMYRCTSCGSAYDYDYFRADRLHEMGEKNLSRDEFGAAVDAYRLLLKKNPHDFLALRGLMLAAAYLNDMDGLVLAGKGSRFSFDSKMVIEVLDNASEKDTEYFEELAKIYYTLSNLSKCNSDIKTAVSERNRIAKTLELEEYDLKYYTIPTGYFAEKEPKPTFITLWVIDTVLFMIMLCVVIPLFVSGAAVTAWFFGFFFVFFIGLIAFVNMKEIYPIIKEAEDKGAEAKELRVELGAAEANLGKLKAEAAELSSGIKSSIDDFVEKDKQIMAGSVKEKVQEQVTGISKIKKHQCPSCGGSLRIDLDKQMYHCTFCGSTYDYEYFRQDSIHEAGETYLSRGEFMATTEAYEFMLKKDPHDFQALRGLMLTAAHMTSMDELDRKIESEEFTYDSQMVNDAIESALDEDKGYFIELARVYSEKRKLVEYTKEIEDLRERKANINSVIAENNAMRTDYYIVGKDGTLHSPKPQFIIFCCVSAWCLLWTLFFGWGLIDSYAVGREHPEIFLTFLIPTAGALLWSLTYNFIVVFPRMRKLSKFDHANSRYYVEAGAIEDQIKSLENKSANLLKELRISIHDFVRKDRLIMRRYKS
ncbi:MAG: hypothetical protein IKZ42_08910 [Clostridiales bacterium]|nr:hypothetical protein [Clostridiales bacterium]